jgi:hypothetical protein
MTSNSEARKRQEEAAKSQCDHLKYGYADNPDSPAIGDGYVGIEFTYCPLCGEKL